MKTSFLKKCFIKTRNGDTDIISGNMGSNDFFQDVTVRLNGYAIVPIEHYQALKTTAEKVDATTEG